MPILENRRHELFSQEIAKGASGRDAYREAGYACKSDDAADACASRLLANARVADRVGELLEEAAERSVVTVETITANLFRIAAKAEKLGDASGLSVARAANTDVAKLNGLIIDRTEARSSVYAVSGEPLSAEEWLEKHAGKNP